jgi:hypothetical protein
MVGINHLFSCGGINALTVICNYNSIRCGEKISYLNIYMTQREFPDKTEYSNSGMYQVACFIRFIHGYIFVCFIFGILLT